MSGKGWAGVEGAEEEMTLATGKDKTAGQASATSAASPVDSRAITRVDAEACPNSAEFCAPETPVAERSADALALDVKVPKAPTDTDAGCEAKTAAGAGGGRTADEVAKVADAIAAAARAA